MEEVDEELNLSDGVAVEPSQPDDDPAMGTDQSRESQAERRARIRGGMHRLTSAGNYDPDEDPIAAFRFAQPLHSRR